MNDLFGDLFKSAVISGDYRYKLTRAWDDSKPKVCWIMLNPSTANHLIDDPTIRRIVNFSQAMGYGSLVVVNLFALRATNPKELLTHKDPIGELCLFWIMNCLPLCESVICAWGTKGGHLGRDKEVYGMVNTTGIPIYSMGLTKAGHPRHPLYLPKSTDKQIFKMVTQ